MYSKEIQRTVDFLDNMDKKELYNFIKDKAVIEDDFINFEFNGYEYNINLENGLIDLEEHYFRNLADKTIKILRSLKWNYLKKRQNMKKLPTMAEKSLPLGMGMDRLLYLKFSWHTEKLWYNINVRRKFHGSDLHPRMHKYIAGFNFFGF